MATANKSKIWLVTGGAGFIGSHIVEELLKSDHKVITLDNYSTGPKSNLLEVQRLVGDDRAANLQMIEGDIRDTGVCEQACLGVDYVLHLAAQGSVPLSIEEPLSSLEINAQGFNIVIEAARKAQVKRVVYSSSSAVYGDDPTLPKKEETVGHVLSPYAAGKKMNELTAEVYHRCYGSAPSNFSVVGLRYFNVFGPRQSPNGAYAAVIPQWILRLASGQKAVVYGDGSATRDFCAVANVVDANLLAATAEHTRVSGKVYNIAMGTRMSLVELHSKIVGELEAAGKTVKDRALEFAPFRKGDILHSHADISRAKVDLKFAPKVSIDDGLRTTVRSFLK